MFKHLIYHTAAQTSIHSTACVISHNLSVVAHSLGYRVGASEKDNRQVPRC
jgi:hypothetical protein